MGLNDRLRERIAFTSYSIQSRTVFLYKAIVLANETEHRSHRDTETFQCKITTVRAVFNTKQKLKF